ncbi:hypothetical protein [Komagataeibacter sp. FNDCR2]|uniref:hypothetical protein n=1 Tax=Komagataeibacter sp. FNDCR2 TaxID=2878682 RepID=UPI001E4AD6EC|nr:hypothetical protein [Komagataeibacter sp. FNDCR2]MCE2576012.1 hypothetical protein [Komagataeibacter sp. FNDCR2]
MTVCTGLDVGQLKREIVLPTLQAIALDGPAAVNLLTGIALAESRAAYLRQFNGPALGLWQMEPATHEDCWNNFLHATAQAALTPRIRTLLSPEPRLRQLVSNLRYACAMARVQVFRAPAPLPPATDAAALSAYHKQFYNTALGAANAGANRTLFQAAIDAM